MCLLADRFGFMASSCTILAQPHCFITVNLAASSTKQQTMSAATTDYELLAKVPQSEQCKKRTETPL